MLPTLTFDETNTFICYASPLGIKIHNLKTSKLVRLVGKGEISDRFIQAVMYQSRKQKTQSSNANTKATEFPYPTLLVTAHKKNRFYLFSRREPSATEIDKVGRDIFNEKSNQQAA